jgi:D-sedoheptulose 7-phosphate isomerase
LNDIEFLQAEIAEHQAVFGELVILLPELSAIGKRLRVCLEGGGKILLMGNGGSAADSQHIAAEIVGRYKRERRGLPAIALTTDTSILTSIGNDYGFDFIFSRQVEALCNPLDVVIGISTSGDSSNVVLGIKRAKEIGATTVALTGGTGGKLVTLCDHKLVVPSTKTARIQEAHIFIGHSLCDLLEVE